MSAHLLDPRNGEAHDLPPLEQPARSYIIASVPRSGSTLLARMLWDTGCVGAPKEYLNPMQLRDWEVREGAGVSRWLHGCLRGRVVGAVVGRGWSEARLRAHLERVRAVRSSGGWFGMKLHHHHYQRLGGAPMLGRLLPQPRWIRIRRDDRLGQALSWHRALETDRWAHWQEEVRVPRYRRAGVRARLEAIGAAEAAWDRELAGKPVWEVTYERLVQQPEKTVREVLAWLDVPDAHQVGVSGFPVQRQADAESENWRIRWASGA